MGSASASASAVIDAPIDVVWRLMVDTDAYGSWNPFIVSVGLPDGPLRPGARVVLHVRWVGGGRARATERVTELSPPADGAALLEYEYGGPVARLGLVRGRRRQALRALPDGRTSYATDETLTGWAARLAPITRVRAGFEAHAAALKAAAEAR